jgi:hypothetical protein
LACASIPKQLLNTIQNDTRSITGSNIRKILLLTSKESIEQITDFDIEIEYAKMSDENRWRVNIIKEITDVKFGQLTINGFSEEECEEILQFACITQYKENFLTVVPSGWKTFSQ